MTIKKVIAAAFFSLLLFALTFCSSDDLSVSGGGSGSGLYCDFGPITEYGGGCFAIDNSSDCDTEWGEVVSSCPASSGGVSNNGGGSATVQKADGIRITLTSYSESKKGNDLFDWADPKVSFKVVSGSTTSTTPILMEGTDLQSWSGSKSATVTIDPNSSSIKIYAIVKDVDALIDDDISPTTYWTYTQWYIGSSENLKFEGNNITINAKVEFIKR